MRTRHVKLTAQQLLGRNSSEAIVDKDNHARDAMKYILMSHPEPTVKSFREKVMEVTKPLAEAGDLTSALAVYFKMKADEEYKDLPPQRACNRPRW